MKKILNVVLLILVILVIMAAYSDMCLASAEASSKDSIIVKSYWGKGCSECVLMEEFLNQMKLKYIGLKNEKYEIYFNNENKKQLEDTLKQFNKKFTGVPIVIIEGKVFTGYGDNIKVKIEDILKEKLKPSSNKLSIKQVQNQKPKRTGLRETVVDSENEKALESLGTNDTNIIQDDTKKNQQSNQANNNSSQDYGINEITLFGGIYPSDLPLAISAILVAFADSLNPCAFFILFSMLGLLVHAQSRSKVLFAGGIFVAVSGIIYFIFMAAWLNLFLVAENIKIVTILAAAAALIIAGINIKDFFIYKQGISLTISQENINNLFKRMRKIAKASSWAGIALAAAVLAIAANAYEVLCTTGFPMAFTRILTLNNLSISEYYFYLVLYNIAYVIPLAIIVVLFAHTMERFKMKEIHGRVLKLISGVMMLGLGAILLFAPQLMENIIIMVILIGLSLAIGFFMGYIDMHKRE